MDGLQRDRNAHARRDLNETISRARLHAAPALAIINRPISWRHGRRISQNIALAPEGRIIAVTGYGQDADRQRARAAGFDAHLVKPVTLDLLIEALGHR